MSSLYSDFKKNIINIIIGEKWSLTGSFKRNTKIYEMNINFITDIDVQNFVSEKHWNDIIDKIKKQKEDLKFLYLTCGINENFVVDWKITDNNDLSNINFKKIEDKINDLRNEKLLDENTFLKWNNYIKKNNLEGLLLLENEMFSKMLIRWTLSDIEKGFKYIGNVKYEIEDMFENYTDKDHKDYRATFHWLWLYKDNIIPLDVSVLQVDDDKIDHYFPKTINDMREYHKKVFYKNMFVQYYLKNWFKLFRELKWVAKDFNLFNIYKNIKHISEVEYALHKAILSKLSKLSLYIISDTEKKVEVEIFKNNQDYVKKIFEEIKKLMTKIGYNDYNKNCNVVEKEFKEWLDKQFILFYNEYRKKIINEIPSIINKIPPEI